MSNLSELIERVENLTGPDRLTDGVIWAAIQGVELLIFENPPSSGEVLSYRGALKYPRMAGVGRYTASIDAALTLLPEGWWWSGGVCKRENHASVGSEIGTVEGERIFESFGANLPLALCAAILRARLLDAASSEARG